MYTPTNWQDRISQNPGQFSATGSVPGNITLTLNDNPTQAGTPVTAAAMNNMETELLYLDLGLYGYEEVPVAWDAQGNITEVDCKASSGNLLRKKLYTFTSTLVTETITTGAASATINHNFDANGNWLSSVKA